MIGHVILRANISVRAHPCSPSARFISTSPRLAYPGQNPVPTASEDAVAADRGEHETTIEEHVKTTVKQTGDHVDHQQHPGKSDIEHLESPSISEEAVHADRLEGAGDPLVGKTVNAKSHPVEQASGAASNLANAAGKVVDSVKEAVGLGGKRSFSTNARRMAESHEEDKTHPQKSGHEHLEKPSQPEEEVHADKSDKDPLAGTGQKASERKGDKAGIADSPVQQSKN